MTQVIAAALMAAGIAVGTIGTCLIWGVAVGLLVLAGLLIALSLLIGWE